MDSVLVALAQNIPAAVALIIAIVYFLRAIKDMTAHFQEILRQITETYKTIFESQRDALNLIATHIKELSTLMASHDVWQKQALSDIQQDQQNVISQKIREKRKRAKE
jgi:hypothetical protein